MERRFSALDIAANCLKFTKGEPLMPSTFLCVRDTKTMLRMENENQGHGGNRKPPVLLLVSRDLTSNLASSNNNQL